MEESSPVANSRSEKKFERVPRVTRSRAAAQAAASGGRAGTTTSRGTSAARKIKVEAATSGADSGCSPQPVSNREAGEETEAVSSLTNTSSGSENPAAHESSPQVQSPLASEQPSSPPSQKQADPPSVTVSSSASSLLISSSTSTSVSAGIHVTTTDLQQPRATKSSSSAAVPSSQSGGSDGGSGGGGDSPRSTAEDDPVKVEAVIDLVIPAPITAALEELLASQQCLTELEKAGAAVATHGDGLSQLLRAATAAPTSTAPEKVVTTTVDMGLTLLAQAAAQEEKTSDSEPLPPISQLTTSGFTLNDNPVIYQQTAAVCMPDAGAVDGGVTYTSGTGVATWTGSTADLNHYNNWFSSMVAGMNPTQPVPPVPLTQDHLQLPVTLPGIDTLNHPQMLLFDTLTADNVPPVTVTQTVDMQTQLSNMAAIQRQTATIPESMVPGSAETPAAISGSSAMTLTNLQTGTSPGAEASDAAAKIKMATPTMAGNVYQQPKCAYCDRRFQTRTIRDQHARECPSNPYKCPTCSKACLGQVKLQRHIRSHLRSRTSSEIDDPDRRANNGPDPKCAYCGVRFPSRVVRDRHSRMCDRNPYRCKLCNKAFLGTAKLTRHMRVHTIEEANRHAAAHVPLPEAAGQIGEQKPVPVELHATLTGSDGTCSSSPGSSGTSTCNSSEINDVIADNGTGQSRMVDAGHPIQMQSSLLSLSGAGSSLMSPMQPVPGVVPSINVTSEGLALPPNGVQLPGQDGMTVQAQSVGDPAAISQAQTVANTFNATGQCVQAPLPPSVPMMVAMPLLSCW